MPSDSDSADEVEMHYPIPCAFCRIADAYPPTISSIPASKRDAVPSEESFNSQKIQPPCFLILNDPLLMAFLDIMPMARGHVLVATRKHRRRIGEVEGEEGRSVGWYLPILSRVIAKVIGVNDYNIVQNNGLRAAQVVPHVHFHIIPRSETRLPTLSSRSWMMFGRGMREDLDDEEGEKLARELREELRRELRRVEERGNL